MSFFIKNKKYFYSLLLVAVVFSFALLPPLAALAEANIKAPDDSSKADGGGIVSWLTGKSILFVSSTISWLFGALFGVILYIEAQIIDYVLSPVNFPFVGANIVKVGWGITRDLANMFFILILLVIAFATVLKIDSYAIKQLWFKTLVAALLINFSLVIAGLVIDFTQVLTTFFLKQAVGGSGFGTITTRLASSMQILNFYNPAAPGSITGGIAQFGESAIAAVIGIILSLVGLVITVFVFGATAIFLVVRIIWIWFLLIVAPFAWMLWILPATSGYFKQWWDKFISWTFFAPAYAFMIYLSLSIFDANGRFMAGNLPANSSATWGVAVPGMLTTIAMPAAIFQWILVIALMFGSLIVAKSIGVLPGKLIDAVTGATKGAARATALSGVKTYGHIATAISNIGASRPPGFVRTITAPIRGIATATGIKRLGALATGAKGGVYTAPLKSTPNNPLKAITNGAVKGSGLWKNDIKDWQCAYDPAIQVRSKKKPTYACPQARTVPGNHPQTVPPGGNDVAWIEV
ncbi:MAG: hypothetical protein Q7S78_01970 [Candidatus Azambacteria bacterium]|nr:hypothetical protein [Candidatus Azambacteria bacterium]